MCHNTIVSLIFYVLIVTGYYVLLCSLGKLYDKLFFDQDHSVRHCKTQAKFFAQIIPIY
jgi:hypothetical protein